MQIIREMRDQDAQAVFAIDKACFSDPWTAEMWQGELARADIRALVLEEDGKILGFALASVLFEDAELPKIAVLPTRQKSGFGEKLLTALCKEVQRLGATKMFLEVRINNVPARKLYERNGFVILRTRYKYYPDGEDALEMKKDL